MSKLEGTIYILIWVVWIELALWGSTHNWQLSNFLEMQWLWILAVLPFVLIAYGIRKA
jgi:hypothetical protein